MDSLSFFVPGLPKTQGSMKAVSKSYMKHAPGLEAWRDSVKTVAKFAHRGPLWDGPVCGEIVFHLPFPTKKGKTLKPANPEVPDHYLDLDKLMRAIGDALEKAIYTNDVRICGMADAKIWADPEPGVMIKIWQLAPGASPLWWREGPPL